MPDITNGVAAQPQGLVVEYTLVRRSVISLNVLIAPGRTLLDRRRRRRAAVRFRPCPALLVSMFMP